MDQNLTENQAMYLEFLKRRETFLKCIHARYFDSADFYLDKMQNFLTEHNLFSNDQILSINITPLAFLVLFAFEVKSKKKKEIAIKTRLEIYIDKVKQKVLLRIETTTDYMLTNNANNFFHFVEEIFKRETETS